jgi:hypothetical protein
LAADEFSRHFRWLQAMEENMASSNGYMTEFEPELDALESGGFGYEQEQELPGYMEIEGERVFDEADEMDLAARLLEVTDEGELDQFLGDLFKRVGRVVGQFVRSPVGQALGGILKNAARKALPIAGRALGTYFAGPAGGPAGATIASQAGKLFGLELEGLSPEDQEFEVARQFVRFAGAAAKNAAQAEPQVPPQAAARAALVAAARQHAPGLLRLGAPSLPGAKKRRGQWVRRGRNIIIVNC